MPDESVEAILKSNFGFNSFRPGQREAIQSLQAGNHSLVVMPTGSGKSLIYQLVALNSKDLTLVISPLIALMKDQVDNLIRRGISATYINSSLEAGEQANRLKRLSTGDFRIVYVAPERLRNTSFLQAIKARRISLLAVDEAHCVSEWGHDFRPDYLYISHARSTLESPLTVALTATATPKVQGDIVRLLGLTNATRIITGFNRPNLFLHVRYSSGLQAKYRALKGLVSDHESGAVIIYTSTRRDAEEVAEFVHEVIKIPASYYHAGLSSQDRIHIQNEFITDKSNVIVATNAFGMGIDRSDVRQVIHFSLTGSLEAYYQEAGRAGRDGMPARATLLYDPQDRSLQEFFIQQSELSVKDLRIIHDAIHNGAQNWTTLDELSQITGMHPTQIKVGLSTLERADSLEHLGDEGYQMLLLKKAWHSGNVEKAHDRGKEHILHRKTQLDGMINYAESSLCRRKIILDHFGDTNAENVAECCDNCRSRKQANSSTVSSIEMEAGDRVTFIILDCIRRNSVKVGRERLAQILHGSHARHIHEFHYDRNPYYGRLGGIQQDKIRILIEGLIEKGDIKTIGGRYPVLHLTPHGENALKSKENFESTLAKPIGTKSRLHDGDLETGVQVKIPATKKITGDGESGHSSASRNVLLVKRVVALGESGLRSALPELIDALQNTDGNVRRLAASALGKIRDEKATEALLEALSREEKPQVRQYIVKALGAIASLNTKELLQAIADDENEKYYTRKTANNALKHFAISKSDLIQPASAINNLKNVKIKTDTIESFVNRSHPRPIVGPWQCGWSLGFHSRFVGKNWERTNIGDLTYRLKYEKDLSTIPLILEQALVVFSKYPELGKVDVIVPVPPSTVREVDPVKMFSLALSDKIKVPMQTLLFKERSTQPQKELKTMAQKRANVHGTFGINGNVRGKRFLITDDLFDSGATLEEITRLLFRNGAALVNAFTLSRTIHSDL